MEKTYSSDPPSADEVSTDNSQTTEDCSYQPIQWLSLYKQDIAHYKRYRKNTSALRLMFAEQGLWALLQYRVASATYHSHLPRLIKTPLLILATAWLKFIEMTTGISLPHQAIIGPGLYIGH